jgi:serine/threonine-protein kinase RsbW
VLNEVISNAIRHGNKNDVSKHVKLTVGTTENGYAFFIVEDEGEGFYCGEKQFCCTGIVNAEDLSDVKESGRGILIVNNLCDRVKFNNKGNKVVLLKKIIH